MAIEYRIIVDDSHQFDYQIELDRGYDASRAEQAPKWTRLEFNQCSNCPLKKETCSHCPAAVDLFQVIEDFRGLPAVQKADITVLTPEPYIYDAAASGHNVVGWSPYNGIRLPWRVSATYVRGRLAFDSKTVLAAPGAGRKGLMH